MYNKYCGQRSQTRMWGFSSAGRAPALHAGGQEFESPNLHHKIQNDICCSVFYYAVLWFDEKFPKCVSIF